MKIFASIAIVTALSLSQIGLAEGAATSNSSSQNSSQQLTTVNINTAGASQLASVLKGVGSKKAQAILDYRKKFGPFKSIDELTAVKGIGSKTLQKNRSKISI